MHLSVWDVKGERYAGYYDVDVGQKYFLIL